MNRFWKILPLLLVVLLLCGCAASVPSYTVEDRDGKEWHVDTRECTVSDGHFIYLYSIRGDKEDYTMIIHLPSGNCYTQYILNGETYGSYSWGGDDPLSTSGEVLAEILQDAIPEPSGPKNYVLSIALILLGLVNLLWPKGIWIFRYGKDFRQAEPSKLFLRVQAAVALAAVVVGILLMVL